jgi:hypothetical protein
VGVVAIVCPHLGAQRGLVRLGTTSVRSRPDSACVGGASGLVISPVHRARPGDARDGTGVAFDCQDPDHLVK